MSNIYPPRWADEILQQNVQLFGERVDSLSRREKMELLKLFYIRNLCEDCLEGSSFDHAVTEALARLQAEFPGDG
jgi:hypothetical protein